LDHGEVADWACNAWRLAASERGLDIGEVRAVARFDGDRYNVVVWDQLRAVDARSGIDHAAVQLFEDMLAAEMLFPGEWMFKHIDTFPSTLSNLQ
jgi:hypothetical protein